MSSAHQRVENDKLIPGKYICIPHGTLLNMNANHFLPKLAEQTAEFDEGMWIVDLYDDEGLVCYVHPEDGEARVASGCGHQFYGPIA